MNPKSKILPATPEAVLKAARELLDGRPVGFPTDTVYGLGADATSDRAVQAVFELKRRPPDKPLIVHVPDAEAAAALARFNGPAERLAEAFWPGPLTLVLPRAARSGLSRLLSAGRRTLGLRAPDHAVAQALLRAVGRPLAVPSANISGHPAPTTAEQVIESFGDDSPLVLDGGACTVGVESTIVQVTAHTARLLRAGAIPAEAVEDAIGRRLLRPRITEATEKPDNG